MSVPGLRQAVAAATANWPVLPHERHKGKGKS